MHLSESDTGWTTIWVSPDAVEEQFELASVAKSKSKRKNSRTDRAVKLIPPSSKEARDEGPRLIPLGRMPEEPRVQRYLDLADVALGKEEGKVSKGKRRGQARRT